MGSWGIPADEIAKVLKAPIPGNLYYEISQRQETIVKAEEQILYNTVNIAATKNLYYENHKLLKFDAKIIDVFNNIQDQNKLNIVILDRSAFYPTSGGQQHDLGTISTCVDGKTELYNVINIEKVGHCVLHILDRELSVTKDKIIGTSVSCAIDGERRIQLKCHHTGTHIVFAACRRILGPHVWMHGGKLTVKRAQLDITHFSSVTKEEIIRIQNEANQIILSSKNITKTLVEKSKAELEFGFSLYQGGIVPGNELRIVNIEDTDVEACCGTHCDTTSEVGWIKILSSKRIADGIVRLYYVAGQTVIDPINAETQIINDLTKMWSISPNLIVNVANRFFKDNKKNQTILSENVKKMLNMQVTYSIDIERIKKAAILSSEPNPTIYFSYLGERAKEIKSANKVIVYIGNNFIYGIGSDESLINFDAITKAIQTETDKNSKFIIQKSIGKKKDKVDCCLFHIIQPIDQTKVLEAFKGDGFTHVTI